MNSKLIFSLFFLGVILNFNILSAQNVVLEGYAFEDDNRGFLNEVFIKITDLEETTTFCEATSNFEGFFTCNLPVGVDFKLTASKDVFKDTNQEFSTKGKKEGEKIYSKVKMLRKPGYLFDVTLAEKLLEGQNEVDAIQGALIEIYNNTTKKEGLVLKDHPSPTFQYTLEKGNHYTIMIRKEGFFSKRIEAYVDIDGCILCMDGVSEMSPGVSDNLTEGNDLGTLLANIELERAELNKSIEIDNIYYDYNSSRIKTAAKVELDKLIFLLKNNPSIIVELGSHTDARGKAPYNQKLSQARAESAVAYILDKGEIDVKRIIAKGYGEEQLVNNCADGVKCNDEDHQKNRRTELKIIGYNENKDEFLSLERIIEKEQFDLMLLELANQEEYIAPITANGKEEIETKVEETKIINEVVEEKVKPQVKEVETKVENGGITIIKMKDGTELEQNENIIQEVKEEIVETKKVFEEKEVQKIGKIEEKKEGISIPFEEGISLSSETRIEVDYNNAAAPISPLYTGFKVEIWKSEEPLKENHIIFTQHGNIYLDVVNNSNFSYLLGDYSLFEQADEFMKKFLLPKYNNARVIQYKNGKRNDF